MIVKEMEEESKKKEKHFTLHECSEIKKRRVDKMRRTSHSFNTESKNKVRC